IAEEYLVLYTRDRTETVSQVWLGLTAGGAVCHDHKFDPITMRDFYSMSAYFNNTTQGAMDGNIPTTPPTILVPNPAERPRWDGLWKERAEVRTQVDGRKTAARVEFNKWLATVKVEQVASFEPKEKLHLHAPLSEGQGKEVKVKLDGKDKAIKLEGGY